MVLVSSTTAVKLNSSVDLTQPTVNNNAVAGNVPIGGNAGENNDTVVSSNTSGTSTEVNTLRSEKEVKAKLENTATQFGLKLEEVLDLIQKMTNKSLEDLLKLSQNDYNKLTRGLDKILKSCLVDNKLDTTKLEQAIKDYNIATQTGWTLEGFYDWQQNQVKQTLTDRLIATKCLDAPLDPNDPEYEAKMEIAIEKFFEKELLSKIKPNTPQAEREKIYKAQLQTFGRLLVNTPEGREKELLGAAIDKLYRTNILPAAKAGIESMETEEAKANFASYIDLEEAVTTDSKYDKGVFMTTKDAEELANLKFSNMNADDIKAELPVMEEKANEFFEKNNKILEEIDEKLKAIEENPELKVEDILSKKEYEIYIQRENYFKAGYSGATTGIATSNNSTVVEQRDELLKTITTDIYKIGEKAGNNFYTEVMEQIAKYVKNNQGSLNINEADFTELMDKATESLGDAKYSNTAIAILNQQKSPDITQQAEYTETKEFNSNQQNYIDLGFTEQPSIDLTKPQTMTAELYANTQANSIQKVEQVPQNETEAARKGVKAIKDFANRNNTSPLEIALNLLDLNNLSETVKTWAFARFDTLNNGQKARHCTNMKNNKNKMEAGDLITSLAALKQVNCSNGLVKNYFEERIENLREQQT